MLKGVKGGGCGLAGIAMPLTETHYFIYHLSRSSSVRVKVYICSNDISKYL
jgi:hypothetical protein